MKNIKNFFFLLAAWGLFLLNGCATVQVKYSDTLSGRIAKEFGIEETVVRSVFDRGIQDVDCVKIVLMKVVSNRDIDVIVRVYNESLDWDDVCQNFGVDTNTFNLESEKLIQKMGFMPEDQHF